MTTTEPLGFMHCNWLPTLMGARPTMVWQVSFPSLMRLMMQGWARDPAIPEGVRNLHRRQMPHHHTCLLNEPLQLGCRLAMCCHLW
jgi:hypothetical protein